VSETDRSLGMRKPISRRDFLNGVSIAVAGSVAAPLNALALDAELAPSSSAKYYPPRQTGMRGDHVGSFEIAHELRDRRVWDLSGAIGTGEVYDLVIVGGGLSGLSAAHFFLAQTGPSARVLVLDNHDDFGGHAKRNEFHHNGRLLALNGGTLNIESPLRYNAPSKQLLRDLGIDLDRYQAENAQNRKLYKSLGLGSAYFFDKETWGTDRLVLGGLGDENGSRSVTPEFVAKLPLSEQAQKDLLRLYDPKQPDYMSGLSSAEKKARLAKISYDDFLVNFAKADKKVAWFYQNIPAAVFAVGTDATPALFCWEMGLPGFAGMELDPTPDGALADLPGGQHGRQSERTGGGEIHFPDGNATIARLLVRQLVPAAIPGKTMDDISTATVNYALMDRPGQSTRIRLNSTVVNVKHDGDPGSARDVVVSYVTGGQLYQVRGRSCVMACWNMFIPYLVPDLPQKQKEALAFNVKAPIVYTSVLLRHWKCFQKLGVSHVNTPTMYHSSVSLTEAASLGELRHPQSPKEPIPLHLVRTPCSPGKPCKDQHRAGRAELLATPFETFERNIRDQLSRVLGPGGFDPRADIAAITVNRWPHGYSYTYNSLYDPMDWVFTSTDSRPCVIARQPFGRISIANADAAASPHTDAAILEAHRAVGEILGHTSAATPPHSFLFPV
jgi:spermidine dehydrogenase